jgi:cytochrome c peroxidase
LRRIAAFERTLVFGDSPFVRFYFGVNTIQLEALRLIRSFLSAKAKGEDVDVRALTDPKASDLGRFATSETLDDIGGFKTSTLRDVVVHYNNGGVSNADDPATDFFSGGIHPLSLTEQQIEDLVAFLETLTSPQFAQRLVANKPAAAEA